MQERLANPKLESEPNKAVIPRTLTQPINLNLFSILLESLLHKSPKTLIIVDNNYYLMIIVKYVEP